MKENREFNKRENTIISNKKPKFILLILGIVVVIVVSIYIMLLLGIEKGAEANWSIGVGLFGTVCGGGATLVAVIVTLNESQQQTKILKINDKIKDYKQVLSELEELYKIIFEKDIDQIEYSQIRDILLKLEIDILCTLNKRDLEGVQNIGNSFLKYKNSRYEIERIAQKDSYTQSVEKIFEIIKKIKYKIQEMYIEKYS